MRVSLIDNMSREVLSEAAQRRKYTWVMWLVGIPSVLGGSVIGLTLMEIHWSLFFISFLVADIIFQVIYRRAYISACVRNNGQPSRSFYIKAVFVQVPIVLLVVGLYLVLTSGLR